MNIGALLERFLAGDGPGDPCAIELLYQWYGRKVYHAAYYVLNDRYLAEDVVQEAFVTAMIKLKTLQDPSKIEAWLVRTAINKSYETLRGHRRTAVLPAAVTVAEGDTVLEHVLDDELRNEAVYALRRLPAINQEVAYYKFYGDLNSQEIAVILNLPASTVRSRLKRALELVSQYVGREVGETDAAGR